MDMRQPPTMKVILEGAHAHGIRRPKDACPYPARSPERRAWMEGYDGTRRERSLVAGWLTPNYRAVHIPAG